MSSPQPAEAWQPTEEQTQRVLKELLPIRDDTRGFVLKARELAKEFQCRSSEVTEFALGLGTKT